MVTPANVKSVCLTGGIGSGKSTVALMLVAHGAHLVDTDAIARQLTTPGGAAMPQLAQLFGPGAVDASGALDREHMRQLVFSDASAKARLEAVLHPLIGQHAQQHAARAAAGQPVVFDVPLLHATSPWRSRVQRVLVVDCEEATQLARVAQRPGWTRDAAQRVLAQQLPRQQRRALADAVLFNEGLSLDALRAEVAQLWAVWLGPTLTP
jgi:dephospho-CoA kinase